MLSLQAKLRGGFLLTLGRHSYRIGSGGSAKLSFKLSKNNLKLLTKQRALNVLATATDADGTTAQGSLTLKAPKARKHHRRARKRH